MAQLLDLPWELQHEVCRNLPLKHVILLSQCSRKSRRMTYSMPTKYKKQISVHVENLYGGDSSFSSFHFADDPNEERPTVTELYHNDRGMRKMIKHRFADQNDFRRAFNVVLHVAHVNRLTLVSAFPCVWTKWISICSDVVNLSNKNAQFDINFLSSERNDTEHSPIIHESAAGMYGVVSRVCLATILADLSRRGVTRLDIDYLYDVFTLDVVPFNKFRYLNLSFVVRMLNIVEHKKNKDIFIGFVKRYLSGEYENSSIILSFLIRNPGWSVDPFDKELTSIARDLRQLNMGCCMVDEESEEMSVWQTVNKNKFRISWQTLVPREGFINLRVMASNDRLKGTPKVEPMNETMKEQRKRGQNTDMTAMLKHCLRINS